LGLLPATQYRPVRRHGRTSIIKHTDAFHRPGQRLGCENAPDGHARAALRRDEARLLLDDVATGRVPMQGIGAKPNTTFNNVLSSLR